MDINNITGKKFTTHSCKRINSHYKDSDALLLSSRHEDSLTSLFGG